MISKHLWIWSQNRRISSSFRQKTNWIIPWREHYEPVEITGETSRSWILRDGRKISKKELAEGSLWPQICRSTAEVDQAEWVNVSWPKMIRMIQYGNLPYRTLRSIAETIGGIDLLPDEEQDK